MYTLYGGCRCHVLLQVSCLICYIHCIDCIVIKIGYNHLRFKIQDTKALNNFAVVLMSGKVLTAC